MPWEPNYLTNSLLNEPCYYQHILISDDCLLCPLDECIFVLLDTPSMKVVLEVALSSIGIIKPSIAERNKAIVGAKEQGITTKNIMKLFGISRTTVGRVIRQSKYHSK